MLFYNNRMNSTTGIPDTSLVLVSVMNSPRDLEIARLLGWYRIPLRRAPKVVDVDYLAFYQTSGFDEGNRGKIQFIANVRGHELTTRGELLKDEKDHPRANEEYYKIQIGPLIKLAKPIQATNWKRITFLYTTGKSLKEANQVNDLVIRSEERSLLWRSIRERIGTDNSPASSSEENFDIPDGQLLEILGYLGFNEHNKSRN
jgi:hypothetical protein